ncbi:hypothetical protein JCM24511_09308 [Saitozyma sp. JCM 24511]|nr:hypothetical protein JCM24511_09308 [Saitozyma sp. JCM 24511]
MPDTHSTRCNNLITSPSPSVSNVANPALPREIAFYQLLNEGRSSPLSRLRPFVPRFFGTLRLEGRLEPGGGVDRGVIPEIAEIPESVVLENLSHAYTRPSILDAKLGRVLFSSDAAPEKRARMERQARETTSWETGLRLTGCQTWHAASSTYILTPKSFGKSITPQQLPQGMVRFFPLPDDAVSSLVPLAAPPSPPPTGSASTTFPETTSVPAEAVSLPAPALAPNMTGTTMGEDKPAVAMPMTPTSAARFVGASVLVIYEGDPTRLEDALDRWDRGERRRGSDFASALDGASDLPSSSGSDSLSDSESDSESDDMDGVRSDARVKRRCPPLTVRMIDFAHTSLAEGEGPDEGVLRGLGTLRGLVRGRRGEVGRWIEERGGAAG